MNWSRIALASLLAVIACVGCGPFRGTRPLRPALELRENLVYEDGGLRLQTPCEQLEAERLESGRMQVHAAFSNERNYTAECQIKVKFNDSTGRVIEDSGWMPLLMPRREVTSFTYTSLTDKAQDFVVLLRQAR